MKLSKFFRSTVAVITALTFGSTAYAEINAAGGNVPATGLGINISTPIGHYNNGFGISTPFGGVHHSGFGLADPNTGVPMGFGISTPFGGAHHSGFGISTPFGNVRRNGFDLTDPNTGLPMGLGISTPFGGVHHSGFDLTDPTTGLPMGFGIRTPFGSVRGGGFGISTPFGGVRQGGFNVDWGHPSGFGVSSPIGGIHYNGFGVQDANNGFMLGSGTMVQSPIPGMGMVPRGFGFAAPFPGMGISTPFGSVRAPGFNLDGTPVQDNGMIQSAPQGVSGVQCSFGEEALLAASVDSCENAGGAVLPSQMSYIVQCTINGEMVMTPSSSSCSRIGGDLAAVQ